MTTTLPEARALDETFLAHVRAWSHEHETLGEGAFEHHALSLFAHQIAHNEPYARFSAAYGFTAQRLPQSWREIPAVPAGTFKDASLATFDIRNAELIFHTSGTSAKKAGHHYVERAALYDASLLAGFEHFMLPARADGARPRFLNLVPNPRFNPHSSLGYMVGHVSVLRGDGKAGWFLGEGGVDADGFSAALRSAISEERSVCITGTAFALVALLDALDERDIFLSAPPGSRIMETGGFKGRSRVVSRKELYARLERRLGVAQHEIVAEYGMTELISQYYDAPSARGQAVREKVAPPWLRTLVVDAEGRKLPAGSVGFLRHVDLGNRSSVLAVETEDRGYATEQGIVLLGREIDAPPRGCSLDAEDLITETAGRDAAWDR